MRSVIRIYWVANINIVDVIGMKTLTLSWRFLWARPLGAVLNLLLLGLGLASITFLLRVSGQVSQVFLRDLQGIDAVVGAKGSPMQLILSGVLHLDVPPGNVPLKAVQALQNHPMVASLIPISLGDSFRGFRIVGTAPAYIAHYRASLAQGRVWHTPMQVVLGASVADRLALLLGDTFTGSHGLNGGGHDHADNFYTVVGILQPCGCVLDRLILTDLVSVWRVHEDHAAAPDVDPDREVTLALITYKTPLAAVSFPRYVNSSTVMQAAAPAYEVTRLLSMLGLGTDVLHAFSGVLLLTAGLSVFVALWSAVRERRADLALLRMLGAPPRRVAALLLGEALWLGVMAAILGLMLGQGFAVALAWFLHLNALVTGLVWSSGLWMVPLVALGVSVGAALLPAYGAYRVSVQRLLQSQ